MISARETRRIFAAPLAIVHGLRPAGFAVPIVPHERHVFKSTVGAISVPDGHVPDVEVSDGPGRDE